VTLLIPAILGTPAADGGKLSAVRAGRYRGRRWLQSL